MSFLALADFVSMTILAYAGFVAEEPLVKAGCWGFALVLAIASICKVEKPKRRPVKR